MPSYYGDFTVGNVSDNVIGDELSFLSPLQKIFAFGGLHVCRHFHHPFRKIFVFGALHVSSAFDMMGTHVSKHSRFFCRRTKITIFRSDHSKTGSVDFT